MNVKTKLDLIKSFRNKRAEKRANERAYDMIGEYLFEHRARGCCEKCGRWLESYKGNRHHIVRRARGREDTIDNILIIGVCCHNHTAYASGMEISVAEQQALVNSLNKKYNINYPLGVAGASGDG